MNEETPFTPLMQGCALRLFASALSKFEKASPYSQPVRAKLVVRRGVGAEGGMRALARAIRFLREVGVDVTEVDIGGNYCLSGNAPAKLVSTSATILMSSTPMYTKIRLGASEPA